MVRQIAYIAERFVTGIDHEDRVPDSVAGRKNGMDSRQDFVTVLDEVQSVPIRDEVLAGSVDKGLELLRLALISPEVKVRLCDVKLRIGEVARSVVSVVSAEMVNVSVGHHHGVDILRIDPRLFQAVQKPSGCRPKGMQRAQPCVEENELVTCVDDESVLFEDGIVERLEIVGQLLVHFGRREAEVILMRIAERQLAVSRDSRLEVPDLETVESRSLCVEHGSFG